MDRTTRGGRLNILKMIFIGNTHMAFPWPIQILIIITIIALFWFLLDMMIWGLLIYVAALSILAALATWLDNRSDRKTGSRILVWFLNQPLLMECLGICLGLLAGGTGTLTGLNYAITTGIVATIFRWCNSICRSWRGNTLVDEIYRPHMPKDWQPKETLRQAISFPRLRRKNVRDKRQNLHPEH